MLPDCFIPCESMVSPAAAKTVTPASTRYLRKVTGYSSFSRLGGTSRILVLLDHLVAGGPQPQESLGFSVEALAFVTVERSLLENAEHSLRTEVILVVEAVHGREN